MNEPPRKFRLTFNELEAIVHRMKGMAQIGDRAHVYIWRDEKGDLVMEMSVQKQYVTRVL